MVQLIRRVAHIWLITSAGAPYPDSEMWAFEQSSNALKMFKKYLVVFATP
jgi:hypothetical protein